MDGIVRYAGREVQFCEVNPDDSIEGLLSTGCWYELPNLEFIRDLGVSGNYVDVGAYVGTHSLFFSLFCPSTSVYSFEPQPTIYPKLVRNLKANGVTKCKTFNLALSDTPGRGNVPGEYGGARLVPKKVTVTTPPRAPLYVHTPDPSKPWMVPLVQSWQVPAAPDPRDIEVVTLDSLGLKDVVLMKVDVENSEFAVLKGASETLKSVEHLFVEMWHAPICRRYGVEYHAPQIVEFLKPYGLHLQKELGVDLFYFNKSAESRMELADE